MHLLRNRKIIIYVTLFFIIGTFNNKNINLFFNSIKNDVKITGLDEKNNLELINKLNLIKFHNLFFIGDDKIKEIIESNKLVENYSVFKEYPKTLNIKIDQTKFLAQIKKDGNNYLLGSNGKLIETTKLKKNIPFIFGDFKDDNFFQLKEELDKTNFKYEDIKNLFFFKSGRWDIETKSNILIRLPEKNISQSLNMVLNILNNDNKKIINQLDLRQNNQIIINEK